MIIILPDSETAADSRTLSVNVNRFDSFEIRKVDEKFQLTLQKTFDGHFSSQSQIWYVLIIFESYEECYSLFEKIMESLENSEKVFCIKKHITQNALKNWQG